MYFKNLSHRASKDSIITFLRENRENFYELPEETYAQRIADARKNAVSFLRERFPDIDEFDQIYGYFDQQTTVFEEVYFEIGLLLGAKIALELKQKSDELLD
ncbi:MAG: hypothetical protein E7409_02630 [Ruminococcaceae bacterium]|nr:hypothetical protein [Oscillospiraceae bacterium]